MVYLFLGLGVLWLVLGLMRLIDSGFTTDGLKVALSFLVMAVFNVGIAWFLHWRNERRAGPGR